MGDMISRLPGKTGEDFWDCSIGQSQDACQTCREMYIQYLRKNIPTLRSVEWWNKWSVPLGSKLPAIVVQKMAIKKPESLIEV